MPRNFSYVLPNKLAGCAKPGAWGDPRSDLAGLCREGVGAVVSLTEEPLDSDALREVGLRALHLPIPDFDSPTRRQIREFVAFVDSSFEEGLAVAVHCGAGVGRTGTMLACYLVHLGMEPDDAILTVRDKRPGSIETPGQEKTVRDFYNSRRMREKRDRR